MKLFELFVCVVILTTVSALAIQDASSDDKCDLCSDFIESLVNDDAESVPNEFIEFLIFENFQETCMNECGFSNDLKAEFEYDEDKSSGNDVNTGSLIKLAGCETCEKILNVTAVNSHGFDFSSIKYSLRHACENIKGIMDTVKCKLFIKLRESKILQAIYKYKKNARAACIDLKQCAT